MDSLKYSLEGNYSLSNNNFLPHYLASNRYGVWNDVDNHTLLLRGKLFTGYKLSDSWNVQLGFDGIFSNSQSRFQQNLLIIQQGFVAINFKGIQLLAGRKEYTQGTPSENLSSGSLAISNNARPLPQVTLSTPDFVAVPFTHGFAEIKLNYTHAWFNQDRYIKNSYLHNKSLFLKFGGRLPVNFSAGLMHYVIWGGTTPRGVQLPTDMKNYINLVLGKSAEDVDVNDPSLLGESANAVGDHIGVYDFALYARTKIADFKAYHQTPFEDWTGSRLFRNPDRLVGLEIKNKTDSRRWISKIAYEYLSTTFQSGPGRPGGAGKQAPELYGYDYGGRDNLYNNSIYKTGWVYHDKILGTPLFFTKYHTRLFIPGFEEPDAGNFNFNVVNNRVKAHHIGIEGYIYKLSYKLMSTFTTNYGTYGGINGGITKWGSIENPDAPYAFKPAKHQNYFLLEVGSAPFAGHWTISTALAWDMGELYDNFGMILSIKKSGVLDLGKEK